MELSLSGNKKKLKKSEVLYEFTLDLFKPTNKKYPEFDYEELVRESEAAAPGPGPNVDGGQLTDRDKAVVRSLEARYGAKERVNKNKRKRFNFESSYFDKGKGYEQDDSFIDDSEAYDELVPSSMDTLQGGFYVNKGRLEFRNVDEEAWSSEDDDALSKKKETQKSVVEKAKLKQGGDSKVSVGEVEQPDTSKVPRARMAGAPPTKIKATSVARVAKNLMKAKARKEVQSESSSTVTINAPASPLKSLSEAGGEPSLQAAAVDNSIHAEREPQNEPSNNLDPNTRATDNIPVDDIHFSHKLFPEISADVQKLIDEFKKTTEYLAAPGMKKRLQRDHILMIIRIDDQMASDGVRSHERSRVLASISDYVGIQKQSLYLRTKAVRDESKSVTEAESGATTAGTHGTTSKLSTPKTNSLPIPSDSVSSVSSSKSVPHVSTSNNGSVAESPITEVELVKKTPTYQALLKVMPNLKAKHGSDIEIVLSRCILAGKLTPDNMNETAIKLLTGDASTQNAYASFLRKSIDATFAANLSQQMEKLMQASKQHNTQHVTTTKNPKDSPVMRPGLNTATKRPAVVVPSCSSVAPPVKSKPITSAAMSSAKPMASSTQASSTAAVAAVPRPIASPATRTVTPPATQSVSATPAAIAQLGSAFTAKDYPKIQKMFSEYQKAFVEAGKEAVAKSELAKAAQLQNLASLGVDPKLVNLEKNIVWDDALSTAFRNFMSVLVAAWKMLQLDGGVNAKSLEEIAIPTFKSVCSMIDPAFTLRMLVDKAVALCADLRSLLDHPDVKGPTKRRRPPMKPSMSGNLGATTISKPPAKKTAKDADVEVVKLR